VSHSNLSHLHPVWRKALGPYYAEFGIDAAAIPARRPGAIQCRSGGHPERVRAGGCQFSFWLAGTGTGRAGAQLGRQGAGFGHHCRGSAVAAGARCGCDHCARTGSRWSSGDFLSDDLTTQVGTFALLPQIVNAVTIPVIAAGGIADAHGVAAARALGAAGVQAGTAYLLCPEALTSSVHRAALKSEAARHTALTNLFTGRPARSIVNRVIREQGAISAAAPAFPLATAAIAPIRSKAEAQGSGDFSPLWSGQNASACKEIPAAELTWELVSGW